MSAYGHNWPVLRASVLEALGNDCFFCQSDQYVVVHHIWPLGLGGPNEFYNLVPLCQSHHQQEHAAIARRGLCTVPGPEWEPYWYQLTEQAAVLRYAAHLDRIGLDGSLLRARELARPAEATGQGLTRA